MPIPLLTPIIVAGGTAWITQAVQTRAAKIAAEKQHREAELKIAGDIYKEVSAVLDAVGFYMEEEVIFAVARKAKGYEKDDKHLKDDEVTFSNYYDALVKWKTSQNRLISQVEVYYGENVVAVLEKISKKIQAGDKLIAAAYYQQPNSLFNGKNETQIKADYKKFFGSISGLGTEVRKINKLMMEARQNNDIGHLGD